MIYFSGTLKKLHKEKRKPNKRRMHKIMNRTVEKMIGKKMTKAIRKLSKEEQLEYMKVIIDKLRDQSND